MIICSDNMCDADISFDYSHIFKFEGNLYSCLLYVSKENFSWMLWFIPENSSGKIPGNALTVNVSFSLHSYVTGCLLLNYQNCNITDPVKVNGQFYYRRLEMTQRSVTWWIQREWKLFKAWSLFIKWNKWIVNVYSGLHCCSKSNCQIIEPISVIQWIDSFQANRSINVLSVLVQLN